MQNQIIFEEDTGILNSIYHGNQTAESIDAIAEAAVPLITKLRAKKRKVLILINSIDIKSQTAEARKAALDQLNFLDYDKIAIFGAAQFIRTIISFLISVARKKNKIRYFETEAEARAWLLE